MATYSNQHWLLSHIRNSFISTDETGMCETVMASDDMPKHFLKKYQSQTNNSCGQQQRRSVGMNGQRSLDPPLQEVDFVCYPGLDLSDDEDLDMTTQSFDIQMYPEVGAHRFRSNTAQKLEKMDIARRKAARTKNVNFDDEIVPPERSDFFIRKQVQPLPKHENANEMPEINNENKNNNSENVEKVKLAVSELKSKLSLQLQNSPKHVENKFIEYARFDGTSQVGMQTKRINVFINMLPERERNYPMKICVISSAKIIEVIGLVCYKATIQFPELPLKSIRHYALYMTEDNDDMDDFPPLDNREPCSKFGFSHLTLAERRPLAPVTRLDYDLNKSMTSEEEKSRLAAEALRSLQNIELNGGVESDNPHSISQFSTDEHLSDYEKRVLSHNDMLDAPKHRTYRLNFIDKRFFRTEVTLGISADVLEIDQPKNSKFWVKQRQVSYAIDSVAFCEIVERRNVKATLRIWLKSASSLLSGVSLSCAGNSGIDKNASTVSIASGYSPTSPGFNAQHASPFAFLSGGSGHASSATAPHQIRFKHYDFETDLPTAEQILKKLNCILEMRRSEVRTEFIQMRERKLEKSQAKKNLKL